MGHEEDKMKDKEDETKEEQTEEPEPTAPTNPLSNLDLILPPCDVETMMIKRAMVPAENNIPPITSLFSPVQLQITGMQVKIACFEKTTTALKLELKCAELQVEAKEKVDKQKSRLLELLDIKVADLEKKNHKLMNMLEGCISDKQARSNKMIEASNSMERLALKLEQSDKVKKELKSYNDELRTMLNSVESKGTAIAKMAKEKLVKYKEENTRMQGELDDYKDKEDKQTEQMDLTWKNLSDLGEQVQHQLSAAKASETPESTVQILSSIDLLNDQIASKTTQIKNNTTNCMQKTTASNDKLLSHVMQLKEKIEQLRGMSEEALAKTAPSVDQLDQLKGVIGGLVKLVGQTVE